MTRIQFTKMQGTGNDYIYLNLFEEQIENPAQLSIEISHRRFGVGSDGLVMVAPSTRADVKMIMFNADGSRAEMCGNALRCVGKFTWDRLKIHKQILNVETDAGIKTLELITDDNQQVTGATVNLGIPVLEGEKIPSTIVENTVIDYSFNFGDFLLQGTLVNLGNPHLVIFVENLENIPLEAWGSIIEHSPFFPNRINVEFVQLIDPSTVSQRTWERGSGETWSCGTGAGAVCVAGFLTGRTKENITIKLKGGELFLSWKGKDTAVVLKGNAVEVFTGWYEL